MKFGRFDLIPISDGIFSLDGGTMFGIVPKVLWERFTPADERNRIEIAVNCLLIKTADTNILVDTGLGDKLDDKFKDIYKVRQEYNLRDNLKKNSIEFAGIDYVINTHLHFDHCGWNTILTEKGQKKPVLAFSKAKYVIQKQEWYDALHPNERTKASYFKENFLPLEKSNNLLLVDGEYEVVPGVRVINTLGHTKGHQSVIIESEGKKAIYLGDFIPTSAHIRIPYLTSFELYPVELLELKKKFLKQAVDEKWLLIFEHDPKVVFGYLVMEDGKQILKPIQNENPKSQNPITKQIPNNQYPNNKPYDLKVKNSAVHEGGNRIFKNFAENAREH